MHALENMKKNVYNTFCTNYRPSVIEEGLYIIDQQERGCFGTLSEFE
jgi:hypothetical protein